MHGLAPGQQEATIWAIDGPVQRIMNKSSEGLNELNDSAGESIPEMVIHYST